MKLLAIASAVLFGTLATLVLALWLLPGDVVESAYPTLESARRDQLFERGWLPDVLPPSSSHISVSNNLDLNTSWGSFELQPSEWKLLEAKLASGPLSAPFLNWESTVAKHRERGFHAWHHASSDTRWVFFCKQDVGRCEYVMWMSREG